MLKQSAVIVDCKLIVILCALMPVAGFS